MYLNIQLQAVRSALGCHRAWFHRSFEGNSGAGKRGIAEGEVLVLSTIGVWDSRTP